MTRSLSIIAERENQMLQMLHTFNPINHTYIREDIFNIDKILNNSLVVASTQAISNSLAIASTQAINNISRPEISLLTQPISIMNSIYAQTQAIQNITDIYNVVPQMLPFLDIPVLNSYIQDICSNIPNDVLIDFNETELNIIDKIQPLIEAFNKNIYTKIKIKILDNKKKIGTITIFFIIAAILDYLGYHEIKMHVLAITDSLIASEILAYINQTPNK